MAKSKTKEKREVGSEIVTVWEFPNKKDEKPKTDKDAERRDILSRLRQNLHSGK